MAPSTSLETDRAARTRRQREFWSSKYAVDPNFFGSSESDFARWSVNILGRAQRGGTLIELGAGTGRDLRYFQRLGFQVEGVDCAGDVSGLPSRQPNELVRIRSMEALDYLREKASGAVDVVYSNLFYNMDFNEDEHRELFREVVRLLRPDGFHFYCVRTVRDRWYGKGRQVGPDTFDSAPEGTTLHFFSEGYAAGLRGSELDLVRQEGLVKGKGEFPIDILYVAESKRREPPRGRS